MSSSHGSPLLSTAGRRESQLEEDPVLQMYNSGTIASRPDAADRPADTFLIGVCGGTASGKTTVCDLIVQDLADQRVCVISQDSFYRPLTAAERDDVSNYNFDHPSAFDWDLMKSKISEMLASKPGDEIEIPEYDFVTHSRKETTHTVLVGDVVILEGIMIFFDAELRKMLHMLIFVDTDDDLRLARRIRRDVAERGRTVEGVLEQYARFVKPSFDEFILPTKKFADVILPYARQNQVGIDLIVQHIHSKLNTPNLRKLYTNLYMLSSSAQVLSLQTIIRNKEISREEFVFYSDRLLRLLVEEALGHLPFKEKVVTTVCGKSFFGVETLPASDIVGVSVIRSGEAVERALRDVIRNVSIGKMLVDRNSEERKITYSKLPPGIKSKWVILMDPVMSSGSSAKLCIERLIKEGVRPDRIIFVSLIVAPEAVHNVCKAFPTTKFVVCNIDAGIGPDGRVVPGIGNFGDHYFGTD